MLTNHKQDSWRVRIRNWRVDEDGLLRVTAHVLKEGVYAYGADESGALDALPGVDPVMEYIPRAEFTEEVLSSLEGKPVIVQSHTWRDATNALKDGLTVGSIAGRPRVTPEGCVEADMLILDPDAAERIKSGELVEVSAGYDAVLAVQPGAFRGKAYHGIQTGLRFNHVLLLPEGMGRCGYDVRIINTRGTIPPNHEKGAPMPNPVSLKVTIGNRQRTFRFGNEDDAAQAEAMLEEERKFTDETVKTAVAAKAELEERIENLQARLEETGKELEDARAELERVLAPGAREDLARELVEQKEDEEAIIKAETGSIQNEGDGIQAAPKEEEQPKETFGNSLVRCKSMAERRAAVVTHIMNMRGQRDMVKGWSQDAFDGVFRVLASEARAALKNGAGNRRVPVGNARPEDTLQDALQDARTRMLRPMKTMNAKPARVGA